MHLVLPKYLYLSDMVLLMTVSPGFGGQEFMSEVLEKIRLTREYCDRHGIREGGIVSQPGMHSDALAPFTIQVDGGINEETGKACIQVGANMLVSGHYLFSQISLAEGIKTLRNCS